MKICIDAHLARKKIDGIGRYLIGLITALGEIDRENDYLLILSDDIAEGHPLRTMNYPNFTKEYVDFNLPKPLKQNTLNRRIVNRYAPDVYHHPHFDLPFFIDAPAVVTIHDLKFIHDHTLFKKWTRVKSLYMKYMMRSSVVRAKRVITISEFSKTDVLKSLHVKANKINIIHHGINPLENNMEAPAVWDAMAAKHSIRKPFFLFVGEKKTHKNLVRMIEAFAAFNKDAGAGYQFVFVGNTYPRYQEHFQKAEELCQEGDIIFIDYASDSEIREYYRNSIGFVFPSLYEGFGLPALEAMQYGKPVIASNLTALPEITGNAAILVDPYDTVAIAAALATVSYGGESIERLINKGYERLKDFSWQRCAEETLAVYRRCVG